MIDSSILLLKMINFTNCCQKSNDFCIDKSFHTHYWLTSTCSDHRRYVQGRHRTINGYFLEDKWSNKPFIKRAWSSDSYKATLYTCDLCVNQLHMHSTVARRYCHECEVGSLLDIKRKFQWVVFYCYIIWILFDIYTPRGIWYITCFMHFRAKDMSAIHGHYNAGHACWSVPLAWSEMYVGGKWCRCHRLGASRKAIDMEGTEKSTKNTTWSPYLSEGRHIIPLQPK